MEAKGRLKAPLDIIPSVDVSIWLNVFARGLIVWLAVLATEFFLTLPLATLAALSRRPFLGRDEGAVVE